MDQQGDDRTRALSKEEEALLADFRKCSPRRQDAIRRFAHQLASLEWPPPPRKTNVFQFRRRKDD
jgi:hypothetical protein